MAGSAGRSCTRGAGKQREAGLGAAGKGGVSLKAAREKAAEGRALLAGGVNPLDEWRKPDEEEVPTFGAAADDYLAAHSGRFETTSTRRNGR